MSSFEGLNYNCYRLKDPIGRSKYERMLVSGLHPHPSPERVTKGTIQAVESPLAELARDSGFSSVLLCALDLVLLQRCVVQELLPVCTMLSSGKSLHSLQNYCRALAC
jgi:hypothetical protein